jgi:RNA recognition motif-containing protein
MENNLESFGNLEEGNYEENFEHELVTTNINEGINLNKNTTQISNDQSSVKMLNNKTNRNFHSNGDKNLKNPHKHPNRKKALLHLIEFYFSDINLLNDKFLKKLINKDNDKGVDITIIANFNKVKEILKGFDKYDAKIGLIKSAVEMSKKLKIVNNKIVRIKKFDNNSINLDDLDKNIIYVQNLPSFITHEDLINIFSKPGRKVLYVSIPKYTNEKSEQKLSKGFAFVTFESEKEAIEAINEKNNTIPKEITSHHTNEIIPLEIITKTKWLEKKKEFKLLKKELQNENKDIFAECLGQDSTQLTNEIPKGVLVKLADLPVDKKIDKSDIKIWVSHFVEPIYVDYNDKINPTECILRFSHPIIADSFINKVLNDESSGLFKNKKINIEKLTSQNEENYLMKVEQLKKDFQFKKNKRNKLKKLNK